MSLDARCRVCGRIWTTDTVLLPTSLPLSNPSYLFIRVHADRRITRKAAFGQATSQVLPSNLGSIGLEQALTTALARADHRRGIHYCISSHNPGIKAKNSGMKALTTCPIYQICGTYIGFVPLLCASVLCLRHTVC